MDGLTFASRFFGKSWYSYLEALGVPASADGWLMKTITQVYDAMELPDQGLLQQLFPVADDRVTNVLPLQERLFDALLEPYMGQRLSVYTARQAFQELMVIRKEQADTLQQQITAAMDIQAVAGIDESIIDVSGESQRINYDEEHLIAGTEPFTNQYEEENWKLGHKYKDKLGLTSREISWLNKFWNPFNSFLAVEGCCIATIRLYLHCMKKLHKMLENKGSTISEEVKSLQEGLIQSAAMDAYTFTWERNNFETQVYLTLFRRAENKVRECYQHKRKVGHDFSYASSAAAFEQQLGALATGIISESQQAITPPDRETELLLNEMNVTRWKTHFEQITGTLNKENAATCADLIDQLAIMNEKNPSLEHIYYEASKTFAKTDRLAGIRFYLKYIYADLHSDKIDNKQLGKTIQKTLFSNEEQLSAFEAIANKLIATKDLSAALAEAPTIYEKKRRRITLDEGDIAAVRTRNLETVETLNEILQDEEEEIAEMSIPSDDTKEIAIQLTTPVAETPGTQEIVFVSCLNFNEHQRGLLHLFRENNCSLPTNEVNQYARSRNVFKNQLIESINDCCYEQLDDNLIEEAEDRYEINDFYYQKIINLC